VSYPDFVSRRVRVPILGVVAVFAFMVPGAQPARNQPRPTPAQALAVANSNATAQVTSARQHLTSGSSPCPPSAPGTSPCWSGYVATGSSLTSIEGSWVVPALDCTETPGAQSAFWIGIDGTQNPKLNAPFEQTGIAANCGGTTGTTAQYNAWIEWYPHRGICKGPEEIMAGDSMFAEITYDKSTSTFRFSIQDISRWPKACTNPTPVIVKAPPLSSAEWIAEAPTTNNVLQPLADFGTVRFTSCYLHDKAISDFSNVPLRMVNKSGAVEAVPSSLSKSGASFTVSTYIELSEGTGAFVGPVPFSANKTESVVGGYLDASGVTHGFTAGLNGNVINIKNFDVKGAGAAPTQGTFALSINTAGTVAGFIADANNQYHGFVRPPGKTPTLVDVCPMVTGDCPVAELLNSHLGTVISGINDAGVFTGMWRDLDSVHHGFISDGGSPTSFDDPDAGTDEDQGTEPLGINSKGDVTGLYIDSDGGDHGFVRAASGDIASFDAGPGTTIGVSINTAGVIAGTYADTGGVAHGFVRSADGKNTTVFEVPGAGHAPCVAFKHMSFTQGTFALGINTAGGVTGLYLDSKCVVHGFLRRANGAILYPINAPTAATGQRGGTAGISINDAGYVAGVFVDASNAVHGFLHFVP